MNSTSHQRRARVVKNLFCVILIGGCSMLSAILCVPLLKSGSSLRGRAVAHRPVQFAPLHYSSPWTGASYIDAPCSPFSLCSSLRCSLQFVACSDAVQQATEWFVAHFGALWSLWRARMQCSVAGVFLLFFHFFVFCSSEAKTLQCSPRDDRRKILHSVVGVCYHDSVIYIV